ncbi:DUF2345 domain-containing protein [Escherichia coli]|nr:DUF2345 domain-containing protein [Escherichia coli]
MLSVRRQITSCGWRTNAVRSISSSVLSTGGKTQLNLGHNVDASGSFVVRGQNCAHDRHISIRGGAGVFITADKQPFASDKMLSMKEAIAQLENAVSIARSLLMLPKRQRHCQQISRARLLERRPGKTAPAGNGTECAGRGEHHQSTGSSWRQGVPVWGLRPAENTDISALKRFTVAAGEAVSMLGRKAGMKPFAAKGKVEIQAQDDALDAIAKKDVTVTSTEGRGVEITAAKDVVLKKLDGSFIQITGKNIILGCEGNVLRKCANAQKMGAATIPLPYRNFGGYSDYFVAQRRKQDSLLRIRAIALRPIKAIFFPV